MRTFVGIDGGGTKTEAVIADETGKQLGFGRSGPGNIDDVGEEGAARSIEAAVDAARARAGLTKAPFDGVFLGLAGVVSDSDRAVVRRIARGLDLAEDAAVGIDHDCRVALAGGLSGRPGIVLIAGTGSSCYGRTSEGSHWRSAGWGHMVSDEGSSHWLGIQAMTAAVRAYDGRGEATELLDAVARSLDLADMNDIMHRLYVEGLSRSQVAALAPLVVDAARREDAVASGLLERGAEWLARSIFAVARKLGFVDDGCEVALVGGLFRAGDLVLQPLSERINSEMPSLRMRRPEMPPVLGATLLALQQADVASGPAVAARLRSGR